VVTSLRSHDDVSKLNSVLAVGSSSPEVGCSAMLTTSCDVSAAAAAAAADDDDDDAGNCDNAVLVVVVNKAVGLLRGTS